MHPFGGTAVPPGGCSGFGLTQRAGEIAVVVNVDLFEVEP